MNKPEAYSKACDIMEKIQDVAYEEFLQLMSEALMEASSHSHTTIVNMKGVDGPPFNLPLGFEIDSSRLTSPKVASREEFMGWIAKESDFGTEDWWNTVYDFLCGPSEAVGAAQYRNATTEILQTTKISSNEIEQAAVSLVQDGTYVEPCEVIKLEYHQALDLARRSIRWAISRLKGEKE